MAERATKRAHCEEPDPDSDNDDTVEIDVWDTQRRHIRIVIPSLRFTAILLRSTTERALIEITPNSIKVRSNEDTTEIRVPGMRQSMLAAMARKIHGFVKAPSTGDMVVSVFKDTDGSVEQILIQSHAFLQANSVSQIGRNIHFLDAGLTYTARSDESCDEWMSLIHNVQGY